MWLAIVLAIVVFYILHHYYYSIRAIFISRNVDGPLALPIIGNALYFLNKTSAENFEIAYGLITKYGSFFKFWLGPEINLVIQDPQDVEIILSSMRYIDKSTHYDFFKSWLNEGLLLSTGKKWHDRRKIITPAFHFKILEKFVDTFDRLGNTFIAKLYELETEKSVELFHIVARYTLDVMCESAMGVDINAMSMPNSSYVKAVKKITHVFHIRMANVLLRFPFFFKFSNLKKDETGALQVLHGFTEHVIRKRRRELLENNNDSGSNLGIEGGQKKLAFLDILLHSTIDDKPLTDLDIREEVDTFMFEGHDTTTSGITFCLYNLAKNPEVQQKCFNEINEVFGANAKQPATLSLLNQLSYLELAIKESLRLFSPVPFISRIVFEDVELTNKRIVPKGSNIVFPIYTIGRNPEYFEDPEEYRPERFLDEQIMEKKNPFAYIPFSAGPRNCIGQKFAMYEMKCIISKILMNFEVSLTEQSKRHPILTAELILRPENAIEFILNRRS